MKTAARNGKHGRSIVWGKEMFSGYTSLNPFIDGKVRRQCPEIRITQKKGDQSRIEPVAVLAVVVPRALSVIALCVIVGIVPL